MTPDEIRELRCECGHHAAFVHDLSGCRVIRCSCAKQSHEALASALTERLAQAWDECAASAYITEQFGYEEVRHAPNPYRSHADSGRSTGALSDERGECEEGE